MTQLSAKLGQSQSIGFNQPNLSLLGFVKETTHSRIPPSGFDVNLNDRVGGCFDANAHGVKPINHFGCI
jgi:hypothetical protein